MILFGYFNFIKNQISIIIKYKNMNDQKEGKEKLEISVKKANEKQKEKFKTKSLTSKTSGKSLNDMV